MGNDNKNISLAGRFCCWTAIGSLVLTLMSASALAQSLCTFDQATDGRYLIGGSPSQTGIRAGASCAGQVDLRMENFQVEDDAASVDLLIRAGTIEPEDSSRFLGNYTFYIGVDALAADSGINVAAAGCTYTAYNEVGENSGYSATVSTAPVADSNPAAVQIAVLSPNLGRSAVVGTSLVVPASDENHKRFGRFSCPVTDTSIPKGFALTVESGNPFLFTILATSAGNTPRGATVFRAQNSFANYPLDGDAPFASGADTYTAVEEEPAVNVQLNRNIPVAGTVTDIALTGDGCTADRPEDVVFTVGGSPYSDTNNSVSFAAGADPVNVMTVEVPNNDSPSANQNLMCSLAYTANLDGNAYTFNVRLNTEDNDNQTPTLTDELGFVRVVPANGSNAFSNLVVTDTDDGASIVSVSYAAECAMVQGSTASRSNCVVFSKEGSAFTGGTPEEATAFFDDLNVRAGSAAYGATVRVTATDDKGAPGEAVYSLRFQRGGAGLAAVRARLIESSLATDLGVTEPMNLAAVNTAVSMHCAGNDSSYFLDSDDDGVPNNVEAQLGTDCLSAGTPGAPDVVGNSTARPTVTDLLGSPAVFETLPIMDNFVSCEACAEIRFLERGVGSCNSASDVSVSGDGSLVFPGVSAPSCYDAGAFTLTTIDGNTVTTGGIAPYSLNSEFYVLGVDQYGNWAVSDRGALFTRMTYVPPVVGLGADISVGPGVTSVNIPVIVSSRPAAALNPNVVQPGSFDIGLGILPQGLVSTSVAIGASAVVNVPYSISNLAEGDTIVVPLTGEFGTSGEIAVDGVAAGRTTLTVTRVAEPPVVIAITLRREIVLSGDPSTFAEDAFVVDTNNPGQYSVDAIQDITFTYMLLNADGTMVMEGADLSAILTAAQGRVAENAIQILRVRGANDANAFREADYVVAGPFIAGGMTNYRQALVDRGIVKVGANETLGIGLPLANILVNIIAPADGGIYGYEQVQSAVQEHVNTQTRAMDSGLMLNAESYLRESKTFAVLVSDVADNDADIVLDFKQEPITAGGRLIKQLRDGQWRGVTNGSAGNLYYSSSLAPTCPEAYDSSAWIDTSAENGAFPEGMVIRCVRLTATDGGIYDADSSGANVAGYVADPVTVTNQINIASARAGGDGGGSSDKGWIVALAMLGILFFGGSSGIWTVFALVSILGMSMLRRQHGARARRQI